MADRNSFRADLERKKAQLAKIREEKERRSRMLQENSSQGTERIEDADAVLHALGLSASLSRVSTAPSHVSSLDQSRITNVTSPDTNQQQLQQQLQSSASLNESFVSQSAPIKTNVPLQVVQVNQINIPPKEKVYYTKSTQTLVVSSPPTQQSDQSSAPPDSELWSLDQSSDEQEQTKNNDQPIVNEIRELGEEERRQIELREDYQLFIDKATKVLERALYQNESPEIFIQYFPDGGQDAIDNDRKRGNKLSLNRIFMDERWSRNRSVSGFDWSAQYPELLLASYYTNEQSPSDPDGTVLVWNTKFKSTSPEYIFHCQSPIVSCCFAKFHPSLIVGGTYSGQIVLWDMRINKKTPVQRSPLTASAHTHPVYCAKVVGTPNAHNLISISTDGKLCSWSLDMLSAPQETMELNQQKQSRSVAVTCMSFHPGDYNNFLVGSEEGIVYSACRHGSKTGILSSFEGHQGLVTSVDYRPNETQAGYSNLFLTSSIDWTVKLWDSKESEPIHTFESNNDYIYDVKWSPNNPALFATAGGDGRVDIWNLANDSELPTASTNVEPVSSPDYRPTHPSLNKLIWTPSGNQVVVGDDFGRIHMYEIGDAVDNATRPRQEDKWKLGDI